MSLCALLCPHTPGTWPRLPALRAANTWGLGLAQSQPRPPAPRPGSSAQGPSRFLPGCVTSSSAAAYPRPPLASPTALGRAPCINGNRLIPVPHPDPQGTIPTRPCPRPRGLCGAPCPRDTQVHLESDPTRTAPARSPPPQTAPSSTRPPASFPGPDPPKQLFPVMVAAAVFPWLQCPLGQGHSPCRPHRLPLLCSALPPPPAPAASALLASCSFSSGLSQLCLRTFALAASTL